jgi:hypothetical protein
MAGAAPRSLLRFIPKIDRTDPTLPSCVFSQCRILCSQEAPIFENNLYIANIVCSVAD